MPLLSNIIVSKRGLEPLVLPSSPQITDVTTTGTFPVVPINCVNKQRIILKTLFSANNVTCKARLLFLDTSQNPIGYSDELNIENTLIEISGQYFGTLYVIANELSASYCKVCVTYAPTNNGSASFMVGTT